MSSSAADSALRVGIESVRVSLEDRMLREAAARLRWSRGRRVAFRVAPLGPAQGFRLPQRGAPARDCDAWLARLAAAWEPPDDVPNQALGR